MKNPVEFAGMIVEKSERFFIEIAFLTKFPSRRQISRIFKKHCLVFDELYCMHGLDE